MTNSSDVIIKGLISDQLVNKHFEKIFNEYFLNLERGHISSVSKNAVDPDQLILTYQKRLENLNQSNISSVGIRELLDVLRNYTKGVRVALLKSDNDHFSLFFDDKLEQILGIVLVNKNNQQVKSH